jgi:hypothetical protein
VSKFELFSRFPFIFQKIAFSPAGDICLRFPAHRQHTQLSVLLLGRIRDEEESIRKVVIRTFSTAWFSDNEITRNRLPNSKNRASYAFCFLFFVFYLGHTLISVVTDIELRDFLTGR